MLVLNVRIMGDNNFLRFWILLPQIFHRNICGDEKAFRAKLKGNFFREKVSLIPFKNRFVKSVPLSADSGLRLCLKNPQAFEKA